MALCPGLSAHCFYLLIDVALQFMDRILGKGLAATALQLLLFNLAWIIALAAPMAVLIAGMAFARLPPTAKLAVKACGIGFFSLINPSSWPPLSSLYS